MEKKNPLQPFWFDSSRTGENALSHEPRDRRTRDENAGGTQFHTRVSATEPVIEGRAAAEALVRKRLIDQDESEHKRRTIWDSSAVNSDVLTSEDELPQGQRVLYKTSSRPSNASSESIYFFNKIPSSPPAYLSQQAEIPSSPQRAEPTPEPDQAFFTSQATMVANDDYDSSGSESTVDFNINALNRVHGYVSSDYLASEPTFAEHYNQEEVNLEARSRIAQCIEDGSPIVHLDNMGLRTLPDDVEDLKNLVCLGRNGVEVPNIEIYATHNKLRVLTPSLFNIPNLSVLSLRNNKLKKIPGKIAELKKLTYLSVVGNEIKVLPYQILKLPHLTNILVRPNYNLFELKDQDEGTYFCVSKENKQHDVDVRRFVSKIKWVDLPVGSSSQITPSFIDDREMCERMSPVPRLSELALRCFSKYSVTLTETRRWKRIIPTYRQKMMTKAIQKGIYDETCSVCDRITVNPIAKALEWWDFKTQRLVPVRRNFCCANCVQQWLDDVDDAKRRCEGLDSDEDLDIQENGEGPSVEQSQPRETGLRFDDDF